MNQFKTDPDNTLFQLAANFVNHTSRPVFLTGKAGTGKTTFLKYIRESTLKQTVVAAPTGVAAINAGGVTLHSFFQLPFGPFIPVTANSAENAGNGITDQHSLFRNIRFFSSKRKILEEMELLIIDEISMVRADMLDAVDIILRQFRRNMHQPFGGVQVLLIGDLFQLPPVVPQDQWEILKHHYESPFFFHSRVMKQDPPVYIELKKIYRQNDQDFIDILNRVRHNTLTPEDYTVLNGLYDPQRQSIGQDRFITLTSHNNKADSINLSALQRLTEPAFTYEAIIEGDFPEKSFPTDHRLSLRKGAQVMFVKNETGELKRYFNGKLAIVTSISDTTVVVQLADSLIKMELEKETWTNIRYSYNQETGEIEEEEIGSFTQYPVRLAWAITIHKSQGLTFEKAIIDAGNAFAPGRVYVALSRCTTLNGIVLHSRVHPGAIKTDEEVMRFAQHEADEQRLANALHAAQHTQGINSLHKYFDCIKLMEACQHYHKSTRQRKHAEKLTSLELANNLIAASASLQAIADKFSRQLLTLVSAFRQDGDLTPLTDRVGSGINYFSATIENTMITPVLEHNQRLGKNKKTAKYCKEMDALEVLLRKKIALMNHAGELVNRLATGALAEN